MRGSWTHDLSVHSHKRLRRARSCIEACSCWPGRPINAVKEGLVKDMPASTGIYCNTLHRYTRADRVGSSYSVRRQRQRQRSADRTTELPSACAKVVVVVAVVVVMEGVVVLDQARRAQVGRVRCA